MRMFLLTYFAVYGAMHLYLIIKVLSAFPGVIALRIGAPVFSLLMMTLPLAARRAEATGHLALAQATQLAAWSWLPILFWFCCLSAIAEAWNFGALGAGLFDRSALRWRVSPRIQIYVSAALIATAYGWGLVEASRVRLRTVRIATPKLQPGTAALRMVQVSDMHLSATLGRKCLARVIEVVRAARPDVLVFTGDMVDSPVLHARDTAPLLAAFRPPLGKFACTGNHEFYAGRGAYPVFYEAAGIRLLRGESVKITDSILLAGVDDPAGLRADNDCRLDEIAALGAPDDHTFKVLLKHQPRIRPESAGRFDLQLSGHTHGGQIFPFDLVVRHIHGKLHGLEATGEGGWVYVTRGAGTWGPPIRFLARPEVVLFLIEPSPSGSASARVEQ